MTHADGPPISASRASLAPRTPQALVGLAAADAQKTVDRYFASFLWEPSAFDPSSLSASAFLAMLDEGGSE